MQHVKAYSTDLRERIVHAIKHEQHTTEQTASRYAISRATVYRYLQLDRDLKTLQPATSTGRPRLIPPEHEAALRAQVEAHNDATLEEHCQSWYETTGIELSLTAMHQTLKRLKISRKKRHADRLSVMNTPA